MPLEIENLTVKYLYGATAVKELSLRCEDGEKIAVLSVAEGGKTSLLKCIAGLVPAESGKILINGKDVTRSKIKERDICMIYEDGGAMPWRTVRFHLEYPLKLRKIPKAERKQRVLDAANKYSLYPSLADFTRLLYEDDIVRLSFARAYIREAAVYLIDNPFGLLKRGRALLFDEMADTIRALKGAVIFATDSADEAFTVGGKVLVLNYGVTEQIGTPGELQNSPASLYVDKLVNPHNARAALDILYEGYKPYIEVLGNKYYPHLPAGAKEVYGSYQLEEDPNGTPLEPLSFKYSDGCLYACFNDGGKLKVKEKSAGYRVKIKENSFHIFDTLTEKRLTTI